MIKIEHVVCPSDDQMAFVIEGMRNAFNSWDKSDSKMHSCTDTGVETGFHLGEVDNALMCKLARLGSDERKFMRQMPIMMRITAPLYWWKEFDTYKVGTVSNSCSTMHTIAAKEFTHEDFSINKLAEITGADLELLDEYRNLGDMESVRCDLARYRYYFNIDDTIFNLNFARSLYMAADKNLKRGDLTNDEKKHIAAQKKKFWWQMIQLLPNSYNQTRNICMNYEVLANIYKARRAHKLKEWRDFCDFIRTLPYFNIIEASIGSVDREKSNASNEETQN